MELPLPWTLRYAHQGFTGRWLCVAAGGDCLIDYANGFKLRNPMEEGQRFPTAHPATGACDAERELPLQLGQQACKPRSGSGKAVSKPPNESCLRSSLCSLAMAMQQFIETTGQETVGVQTHSVAWVNALRQFCHVGSWSYVCCLCRCLSALSCFVHARARPSQWWPWWPCPRTPSQISSVHSYALLDTAIKIHKAFALGALF